MSFSAGCSKFFQEYMTYLLGAGLSFGVAASMTSEIFFLSKWRKMTAYVEKNGEEKKIDPDTQDLIERVLYRIKLPAAEEATLDFYMSAMSDPTHYGSTKMKAGAVVGLPVSFQYSKDMDLSKESFSFAGIRLVFDETSNNTVSKQLAEAFAISRKAKAFVIARETLYASSYRLHFEAILRVAMCSGLVVSYHFFNKRLPFFSNRLKTWARVIIFAGFSVAWGTLYFFVRDAHRCWLDYFIDKRTARLGKPFAEGGVEYYDSVLERNKALRVLVPDGKSKFTKFGNDVSLFRQRTLQKTTRRELAARILEEFRNEEGEVVAPPTPVADDNKVAGGSS